VKQYYLSATQKNLTVLMANEIQRSYTPREEAEIPPPEGNNSINADVQREDEARAGLGRRKGEFSER